MSRSVPTSDSAPIPPPGTAVPGYESRLNESGRFAMSEATRYFEGTGSVHETVERISRRLDELGIPFVVVGGVAMFHHGFRRFTEDVDILVTRDDLKLVHEKLDGLGFVRPFSKSKNLRDAANGVRIEFLIAGEYPGDGKPKPVAFPDPRQVVEVRDGIKVLQLPRLIELKLASYMTGSARGKDLGDVEELIRVLKLPRDFSARLNPYVAPLFVETWDKIYAGRRFVMSRADAGDRLDEMRASGITEERRTSKAGETILLVTNDPATAAKYGMIDEMEFFE